MGIHHLLTYNISIQYVLVIHVHVTYRVCTSEVKTDEETKIIRCPYCGGTAILRDASFVYGTHSHGGQVYVCSHYPSCNSYVGVHPGTKIPKGTLANRELRQSGFRHIEFSIRSGNRASFPNRKHIAGWQISSV